MSTMRPPIPTDSLDLRFWLLAAVLVLTTSGCSRETLKGTSVNAAGSWSVTAWGEKYEIFPEVGALVAGATTTATTHVTVLQDFSPLAEGRVEIVLRGTAGEMAFASSQPSRSGIFDVEISPEAPGEYGLFFRVDAVPGSEEIPGGKVAVGAPEQPGGITTAPAPRGGRDAGEPLTFLKEEQWRTAFGTRWVRLGKLPVGVTGWARVRPAAGGEVTVTAPVDAVLRPEPWPYPGESVEEGTPLFALIPRVSSDQSLPALEAEVTALETELETAESRLSRLEELVQVGATSRRELEEARARATTLDTRRNAAWKDLQGARSAREGGGEGKLTLKAPISGEVAAILASPGEAVPAGRPLARIVQIEPVWLQVDLAPGDVGRVLGQELSGLVLSFPQGPPIHLSESSLRLVSVAPEIDAGTGRVPVLLELPTRDGLVLGATAEAHVLLATEESGLVVPATAVIDDGGVPVVYLQLSGEQFARQPVRILHRQGHRVLVEGLTPGQRLVTRGGEAIRRASLLAGGEAHGHVH